MILKLHRCGFCGYPTNQKGEPLSGEKFEQAKRILDHWGHTTHRFVVKNHGLCCVEEWGV